MATRFSPPPSRSIHVRPRCASRRLRSASTSQANLTGTYTGVNTAANATSLTVVQNANASLDALTPTNVQFDVVDQNATVLFSYNGDLVMTPPPTRPGSWWR